jgi:hypothetical protein
MPKNIMPDYWQYEEVWCPLLTSDPTILEQLREQYKNSIIESREFTGAGFFTNYIIDKKIPPLGGIIRLVFGDVYADSGHLEKLGFIVFIGNGYLATLEGFSHTGQWPEDVTGIEPYYMGQYGISVKRRDKRDFDTLIQEIYQRKA